MKQRRSGKARRLRACASCGKAVRKLVIACDSLRVPFYNDRGVVWRICASCDRLPVSKLREACFEMERINAAGANDD